MSEGRYKLGWAALVAAASLLMGCGSGGRQPAELPRSGSIAPPLVRQSALQPGGPLPQLTVLNPYAGKAAATKEGERLYNWYNCAGCHFAGGGGIGPPLMDEKWIYGSAPENLFRTILEGRPNGMPSFGGKIPEDQVWMIVTYVESMGGVKPRQTAQPERAQKQ